MKALAFVAAVAASVLSASCGGGGGGYGSSAAAPLMTAPPQVITMSLPNSAIGVESDPAFGLVAGYTETVYSQTLAFVPGAQVMIANGEAGVSHTLNVLSQTAFPSNPALSTAAAGGSTLAAGFASGIVNAQTLIGPITLEAGVYFIGCGFHYTSNGMRTVLDVSAVATPGPQATPVPGTVAAPGQFGY